MKRLACLVILISAQLCGCTFVEVKVATDFPHDSIKKIAVLEFDHKIYSREIVDKVSHGVMTSSNSGDIVADIVSAELEDWGRYEVVKRHKIREILMKRNINEAGLIYNLDRKAIGEMFNVDAIVVGKVDAFEFGFILMMASGKAAYEAQCIDIESGQQVWSFEGKQKKAYTFEEEIVSEIARTAIEEIEEKLEGKEGKGAESIGREGKGGESIGK